MTPFVAPTCRWKDKYHISSYKSRVLKYELYTTGAGYRPIACFCEHDYTGTIQLRKLVGMNLFLLYLCYHWITNDQ